MFGVLGWLVVLIGTARCSQGAGPLLPASGDDPARGRRRRVACRPRRRAAAGRRQPVARRPRELQRGRAPAAVAGRELGHSRRRVDPDRSNFASRPDFTMARPVTASAVIAHPASETLPRVMGTAVRGCRRDRAGLDDIADSVSRCAGRLPSLIEALETTIQKPGKDGAGTGPFVPSPDRAGTDGEPRLLPGPAGHRQDPVHVLSDGARRLGGTAARQPRHALRGQRRLARLPPVVEQCGRVLVRPTLSVHDHLRTGSCLPIAGSETRAERCDRPGRHRPRRPERPRASLVRPCAAPALGARQRRGQVHVQPERSRRICPAGTSGSRASSRPTRSTSAWR